MAQGIAVALGLNSVDPGHYSGWSGDLNACEADANDMAAIALSRKFTVQKLLTKAATRAKVTAALTAAAKKLKSGDIFVLSYSGHGGQVPDMSGDEPDGMDETWCLYDGQIIDDELNALYSLFAAGVRIVVFSDSCHSGTVAKMAYYSGTSEAPIGGGRNAGIRYRFMPANVVSKVYRDHKAFYDKLQARPRVGRGGVKASLLLISGCMDNQLSADGAFNGLFTGNLLQVWKNGAFTKGYRDFHKAIVKRMPPNQTPNYFREGAVNPAFEAQKPFTI